MSFYITLPWKLPSFLDLKFTSMAKPFYIIFFDTESLAQVEFPACVKLRLGLESMGWDLNPLSFD